MIFLTRQPVSYWGATAPFPPSPHPPPPPPVSMPVFKILPYYLTRILSLALKVSKQTSNVLESESAVCGK